MKYQIVNNGNKTGLPPHSTPTLQLLFLGIVFMGITLTIFILYGFAANSVRRYVINSPKMIVGLQRSFAVTFAALGLKLAASDR